MDLVLAEHIGFCPGVKAVVNLTEASLDLAENEGKKLYIIGSLVHNQMVRDSFVNKGVIFLPWDADFENLERGYAVLSAHGVPEELERKLDKLGYKVINGTCKKILSNRKIIKKYSKMGYFLVMVGQKDHSEVRALMATEIFPGVKIQGQVISTIEEIKLLPLNLPLLVISQTTFEYKEYQKIINKIRLDRKDSKILNTICSEIILRRKEIADINENEQLDCALVIGSKESANTASIVQKLLQQGIPAFQIDNQSQINFEILKDQRVGIFSGASTPNIQIENIIKKLRGE